MFNLNGDEKILFYGIGNRGRQDDGLGPRFIENLERFSQTSKGLWPATWSFDANYQLNIEDAEIISHFEKVFFIDASREKPVEGAASQTEYQLTEISPSAFTLSFSTHAMSLSSVLGLSEELYGVRPAAYLLAIYGNEWEISERLSAKAEQGLASAFAAFSAAMMLALTPSETPCTTEQSVSEEPIYNKPPRANKHA